MSDLLGELERLVSEGRNPRTMDIDLLGTEDLLVRINDEDALVAPAVRAEIPAIAAAVDKIVAAFQAGGRLLYSGAGTSGRLGVLDASECPPTFSVPPEMVVGIIAGGNYALTNAVEGAEDDAQMGAADLAAQNVTDKDVVVGIAVSGRTPYVLGALAEAKRRGAATVALTCNPGSPVANAAEISIAPVVGPEVVTGSTRLKSGTAQKLVLNMLTTASMIRTGRTYENLMVDLSATNLKLEARAQRIVMQATGASPEAAAEALAASGRDVKIAILTLLTGRDVVEAKATLAQAGGVLRKALPQT